MLIGVVASVALAAWVIAPLLWPAVPARAGACPTCGPRPEADARFCSNCGAELAG